MTSKILIDEAVVRQAMEDFVVIKYGLEKSRIWGGLGWTYNPMHPVHYLPLRDKAEAQMEFLNQALAEAALDKMAENARELGLSYDTSVARIDTSAERVEKEAENKHIPTPPECKTEAEKTAYAFGWYKALESVREQPAVKTYCGGKPNYCTPEQPRAEGTLAPVQEPVAYQNVDVPEELIAAGRDWENLDPKWHFMFRPLYATLQPPRAEGTLAPAQEPYGWKVDGYIDLFHCEHEAKAAAKEINSFAFPLYTTSPAPCARHCEANAFEIAARGMRKQITELQEALAEQSTQEPDPDELTIAYLDGMDAGKKRKPLTDEQIDLFINGRGDEGDDDYVEPTGDGFGLTDADLVRLVRRVEAAHGITKGST